MARDGPDRRCGATQKYRRFAFRIDREAHEPTVDFQVGEESVRVFMKMQHSVPTIVERAAVFFRESSELSNLAQDRLKSIERL